MKNEKKLDVFFEPFNLKWTPTKEHWPSKKVTYSKAKHNNRLDDKNITKLKAKIPDLQDDGYICKGGIHTNTICHIFRLFGISVPEPKDSPIYITKGDACKFISKVETNGYFIPTIE